MVKPNCTGMRDKLRSLLASAAPAAALLIIACSEKPPAPQSGLEIAVITHGNSTDPFWSVVANGVRAAASDLRVNATYHSAGPDELAALLDSAVAARPNGLIVSIPDVERMRRPLQRAAEAGIPTISIHSGAEAYANFGILAHV